MFPKKELFVNSWSQIVARMELSEARHGDRSEEAREQIKHLFDTVDAMDKKRRRSRGPKS
jgi:hypothetical protein